jgi:hypothetical protein
MESSGFYLVLLTLISFQATARTADKAQRVISQHLISMNVYIVLCMCNFDSVKSEESVSKVQL